MAIVLKTARELGLAFPVSATVSELMNRLIASGGGELIEKAESPLFHHRRPWENAAPVLLTGQPSPRKDI